MKDRKSLKTLIEYADQFKNSMLSARALKSFYLNCINKTNNKVAKSKAEHHLFQFKKRLTFTKINIFRMSH